MNKRSWSFLFILSVFLLVNSCATVKAPPPPKGEYPPIVIPEFPWPPPRSSTFVIIPSEFLIRSGGEVTHLYDVERRINVALEACGYFQKTYYAVPGGFAIVTQLEQIFPDGTPKDIPDRWAPEVPPLRRFSLSEYLRALFKANVGQYRIIVFIITPYPFIQADVTVNPDEARDWLHGGLNILPRSIGNREYSENYICTALIYEFEQAEPGKEAVIRIPSRLTGKDHLEKARLWIALGR